MNYWLHPDAEIELDEAAGYYASHASPALAEAFLVEFERVCDLIVENQFRGSHGESDLRVYHFDRFPYTLIYEPDPAAGPRIFAVAHQHREPGYWASRL